MVVIELFSLPTPNFDFEICYFLLVKCSSSWGEKPQRSSHYHQANCVPSERAGGVVSADGMWVSLMRPYTWQQSQCLLFLSMPKTRASESPGGFQRVRLGLGWPIFVSGIVCFLSSIGTSDKQPGLSFVWNLPVCLVPPSSWPCPLSHKTGHLLGGFVALYLSPSFISSKTASSHAQSSRCGPCSVHFPFPSSFWACVSHGKSQRIMPTSETWERRFLLMSPCARNSVFCWS